MAFGRKKKEQEGGELFAEAPQAPDRDRLTPVEVQEKVFRLAFRGYNERDVDEFLDRITEELAALHEENKRLREEIDLRGPGGGTEEARRHAEEIIRRAREEAARLTAGAGAAPGSPASPSYLVRERAFLQELAGLVQTHAETLKAEARRARAAAEAPPAEAESEPPAPQPEPQPEPQPQPEPEVEEAPEPEPAEAPKAGAPPVPEPAPPPPEPAPEQTAPIQESEEEPEWANPFTDLEGGAGEGFADEEGKDEEEPSLRELFWGEE